MCTLWPFGVGQVQTSIIADPSGCCAKRVGRLILGISGGGRKRCGIPSRWLDEGASAAHTPKGTSMDRRRQIQLTPDEQAAFLREHRKAALATTDKDGFPHIVAMNFYVEDGAFYMTSYGKAQKVVNILRNPKVALMVEAGDEYAELRGVMIRGRCEILEDEASVKAAFSARAGAQANASPVQPGALASAPKRVVLKIVPEKVVSWDHRKLGGRY